MMSITGSKRPAGMQLCKREKKTKVCEESGMFSTLIPTGCKRITNLYRSKSNFRTWSSWQLISYSYKDHIIIRQRKVVLTVRFIKYLEVLVIVVMRFCTVNVRTRRPSRWASSVYQFEKDYLVWPPAGDNGLENNCSGHDYPTLDQYIWGQFITHDVICPASNISWPISLSHLLSLSLTHTHCCQNCLKHNPSTCLNIYKYILYILQTELDLMRQ